MELSQKVKIFSQFFIAFLKFTSNPEYFEKKKDESHSLRICEINDSEKADYLNA